MTELVLARRGSMGHMAKFEAMTRDDYRAILAFAVGIAVTLVCDCGFAIASSYALPVEIWLALVFAAFCGTVLVGIRLGRRPNRQAFGYGMLFGIAPAILIVLIWLSGPMESW